MSLSNKNILVGISGSIAAYKSLELIRSLKKAQAKVTTVLTKNAERFVTKESVLALSDKAIFSDFDLSHAQNITHVEEAKKADLIVIAPITANSIAKMAYGLADEILWQIVLSATCKVMVAPAMETNMWLHPSTKQNIEILKARGISILGPQEGLLASGAKGLGRMVEPAHIMKALMKSFISQDLNHLRVLVTAGPTIEPIDPVRFISNRSSGKMGLAIAEALGERGAKVELICGAMDLKNISIENTNIYQVESAQDMHNLALKTALSVDIAILNAAVSDYKPKDFSQHKIKKSSEELIIRLIKNPDILADIAKLPKKPTLIGFALETENFEQNALEKMNKKNCDIICLNKLTKTNIPFSNDEIEIDVYIKGLKPQKISQKEKLIAARELIDLILSYEKTDYVDNKANRIQSLGLHK